MSNILIHLFPIIYKNDYFFVMKYLVKISWFYMSNLFRNLLLLCCYAHYFRENPHSSSKGFLDIQTTIECGFTLKRVRDMTRTYSQMHRTDKYSEHSSIIWPVWLNGWVFVYELSGCRFDSSCSHLNFTFPVCFEQGVPWHSCNYRVWIHFKMHAWHDETCTVHISTHNTAQSFDQFG